MASTQDALYRRIDLDLSWSERDLPERERTKHVHRLHPYLGKFIPQLVEALLERHVPRGRVLDPFAGSGTTFVQALESGLDAAGVDIAAFNCLLMRVKTREYNPFVLESELRDALGRLDGFEAAKPEGPSRGTCATGSRLRPPRSCCSSAGSSRTTSMRTSFESCWRGRRAPRGVRRISTSTSRARRNASRTGATSTGKTASPWERRAASCAAMRSTRSARVREFSRVRGARTRRDVLHGDARELDFGGALRRRGHLAALSGPDRLPRAAPLRVRAARAGGVPRARARDGGTSKAALAALQRRHRRRLRQRARRR